MIYKTFTTEVRDWPMENKAPMSPFLFGGFFFFSHPEVLSLPPYQLHALVRFSWLVLS